MRLRNSDYLKRIRLNRSSYYTLSRRRTLLSHHPMGDLRTVGDAGPYGRPISLLLIDIPLHKVAFSFQPREKRQNIFPYSALRYCFFILNMLKFKCITTFDSLKGVC